MLLAFIFFIRESALLRLGLSASQPVVARLTQRGGCALDVAYTILNVYFFPCIVCDFCVCLCVYNVMYLLLYTVIIVTNKAFQLRAELSVPTAREL